MHITGRSPTYKADLALGDHKVLMPVDALPSDVEMAGVGSRFHQKPENAFACIREGREGENLRRRPPAGRCIKVYLGENGIAASHPATVLRYGICSGAHRDLPAVLNQADALFVAAKDRAGPEDFIVVREVVEELRD